MSHITSIRLKIKNLEALKTAAPLCGLEFMENQRTHKTYAGQKGTCLHALRLPGHPEAFEIGVVADGEGFDLAVDFWDQAALLQAVGGQNCSKLRQEYAVAEASARVRKKLAPLGFVLTRQNIAGRVRLTAVRR